MIWIWQELYNPFILFFCKQTTLDMFLKLLPPPPTPTPPSSQFQVVGGNAAHLQLALSYRILGVPRPGWYPASWSSLSLATAWACDEWAIPNSFPNLKNTQPNRTEPERQVQQRRCRWSHAGHSIRPRQSIGRQIVYQANISNEQPFLLSVALIYNNWSRGSYRS